MPWSILADVVVAALLIVTLVYVRRLSGRLDAIRSGRAELEKLFGDLAKSTDQAASTLHQFKLTAEITGGDLHTRVERAKSLTAEFGKIGDDLRLLTERAESASNRLEAAIARTRPSVAAHNPASARPPVNSAVDPVDEVAEDDNRGVANLSALSGLR